MISRNAWLDDRDVRDQLCETEALIARTVSTPQFHHQALSPRSKRLRPALLLLASRFGEPEDTIALVRGAAAIELVHEATLYHDDIVDRSEKRRGMASTVGAFGAATAAFAGSELLYSAMSLCTEMPTRVRHEIARTCSTLCRGQIREVEGANDAERSVRERMEVMLQKTASLFRLAARMGGALSAVPRAIQMPLERYATRFGMCFQLADDLRDVAESESNLGKPPRQDLHAGIYTLPVLVALRSDRSGARELREALSALRAHREDGLAKRAADIVRSLGGLDLAHAVLGKWVRRAETELQRISTISPSARASRTALLSLLRVATRIAGSEMC